MEHGTGLNVSVCRDKEKRGGAIESPAKDKRDEGEHMSGSNWFRMQTTSDAITHCPSIRMNRCTGPVYDARGALVLAESFLPLHAEKQMVIDPLRYGEVVDIRYVADAYTDLPHERRILLVRLDQTDLVFTLDESADPMLWVGAVQNGHIAGEWEECLYWKRSMGASDAVGMFLTEIRKPLDIDKDPLVLYFQDEGIDR